MKLSVVLIVVNLVLINAYMELDLNTQSTAFDSSIYEDVLDEQLCEEQLQYIRSNVLLRNTFLEAGLQMPRSVSIGNLQDLGNYPQCLGINQEYTNIQGKYCSIIVPFESSTQLNVTEWSDFNPNMLRLDPDVAKRLEDNKKLIIGIAFSNGRHNDRAGRGTGLGLGLRLSVCVPKPCTTQQGISGLLFNLTAVGFRYQDSFCRFAGDKPWVPADYVAVVIFSIIGLFTLLSTSYDLWHTFILKRDPKTASTLYRSFSVYTNARRLTTFTSAPGALECVDGIRALAMLWVIMGHTHSTLPPWMNTLEAADWIMSIHSLWIMGAPITVDTFFMLSGLLVIYTTAGKLTKMKLLKNLHLFYLNRLLRMFPLLAAAILLEASVFFRISDGPMWSSVASNTYNCRRYWWVTLSYMQNYMARGNTCLPHTWYLAIDMQLYILSPIIIFWLLGSRWSAWLTLSAALLVSLTTSTIYIFMKKLPGFQFVPLRIIELPYYMKYYYYNTLTRASPFVVGMVFGYLLHVCRGKKVEISKILVVVLWIITLVLILAGVYAIGPFMGFNLVSQTYHSLVSSFQRPLWAVALGWMIFACVHGYGGPINWFLSHSVWKLPSRISYGMYLFHYPIIFVISGTATAPIYFTEGFAIYHFLSIFVIAFMVAFVMTLIIDSPFSTLVKLVMDGGPKKHNMETTPKILEGEVAAVKNGNLQSANDNGVENEIFSEPDVEGNKSVVEVSLDSKRE